MTMHVAVAGWLLGPFSGANRRLLSLLQHAGPQLGDRERITVLHAPDFAPPALARIEWQPIDIPRAPTFRRALAERRRLATRLHELGATVYDHGFLPLPPVPIPTCLVVHDVRAVDGLTRWPRWFSTTMLRRSCQRAQAIVTPSHWTAARLRAIAPAATSPTVITNGVDVAATMSTPPARRSPGNGYLLHVGHVEARKNLVVVVRALALLPKPRRPELWLVGQDAGALAQLRRLAQHLDCAEAVAWLGAVDEHDLAGLYAGCRAVVVPSQHEGFGLCALEGLNHGRPVLVSNAAALPEVVGELGRLLRPDDARAWAEAIGQPEVDGPSTAADRRAWAAKFSWRESATRLLHVWRHLHSSPAADRRSPR